MAYSDFDKPKLSNSELPNPELPNPELPNTKLLDGWELLTIATSNTLLNSYFGAVFLHPKNYQIVIAHRGTASKSSYITDVRAVVLNEMDPQMDTACTLVKKVSSILRKIEEENDIQFQMFITGHSLGGWLAQVTTFASEYLAIRQSHFVKADIHVIGETRHAHTVTFESPGCNAMLSKMQKKFGRRYEFRNCSKKALDISNYLSSPNIINAIREHVGQVFRIVPTIAEPANVDNLSIIRKSHAMNNLLEALEKQNTNIVTVLDWPIPSVIGNFTSWIYSNIAAAISWLIPFLLQYFISWICALPPNVTMPFTFMWTFITTLLPMQNFSRGYSEIVEIITDDDNDNQQNIGLQMTRYTTSPVDPNKNHLHVFTESEKTFLELYLTLQKFPLLCKPDVLFAAIKNKRHRDQVQKSLKDAKYKIDNDYIQCKNASMQLFIPYIQQLLQRHSNIIEATKKQSSEFNIRKECYQNEHSRFVKSLKRRVPIEFTESSDTLEFSVWQVISDVHADIHLTTLKMYHQVMNNVKYKNDCTVLKLKQLLHINHDISFQELVNSQEMKDHLFIIDCKKHTESHEEAQPREGAEPRKGTKPREGAEHREGTEPREGAEPSEGSEPSERAEPQENAESSEDAESHEGAEPREGEELRDGTKPSGGAEPQEDAESHEDAEAYEDLSKLLDSIERVVNVKQGIKFIFITTKDDALTTTIQEKYRDTLGINFKHTDDALEWDDLTPVSQSQILEKKVVHFQGEETCLNDIINIASDECSKIFDSPTLNQLIKGEHVTLGNEAQRLSALPAAFVDIPEPSLINVLCQCTEEALLIVTSSNNISSKESFVKQLDIPSEHAKTLMDKTIIEVSLEETNNNARLQTSYRKKYSKIIFWVEVMNKHLFCKAIYHPKLYFQQQFYLMDLKCHIKQILTAKSKSDDAFVISNVAEKQELLDLLDVSENQLPNFIFFAPTETEAENLFNDQLKCYISVHWLKVVQDGHLIWYRTHGKLLKIIRNCQNSENIVVEMDRLCAPDSNYTDRIVIIAGDPGTGKSTTLTRIAEHVNGWIIRRELASCQKAIADLPIENITIKHVTDFLSKAEAGSSVTPLFRSLLAFGLDNKTKKRLHLMFDGFDEIDSVTQTRFLGLMKFLKRETKCKIWVTTRNNFKKELEDALSAFAITFKEIDEEMQQNFLCNFWEVHHTVTSATACTGTDIGYAISKHAETLLGQAKKVFGKDSSFMGVPLQLRMIAEAYAPNVGSGSIEKGHIQNASDLFQAFVDKKLDIYFHEKTGCGKHLTKTQQQWLTEPMLKKHRILAFQKLFPNNAENFFAQNVDDTNSDLAELNLVGIIQSNIEENNHSFIHHTFAEYFLADLILQWLKRPNDTLGLYQSVEDFLLKVILLKPDNKFIRLLIDGLLATCTEKNSIPEYYKCRIASCLTEKEEEYYNTDCRTAIYIALEENLKNLLAFLINCFKVPKVTQGNLEKLLSSRDKNRKTVLYVAAEKLKPPNSTNNAIVEQFLNAIKDAEASDQERVLLAACFRTAGDQKNEIVKNLLQIAECYPRMQSITKEIRDNWKSIQPFLNSVAKGTVKDVEGLLNKAGNGEMNKIFRRYLVATTDSTDKTALYLAAKAGNTDIIKLLIQEGAKVNSNYDLVTPLHAAAENGKIEVVTQLLLENARVNATDKEQKTPLHYAVSGKTNINVITKLLGSGAIIDAHDKAEKTPLHYAVAKGNKETVNALLENGAKPEITTPDDPFCCMPEVFEMNAETFPKNLRYSLYCKHVPKSQASDMPNIADCYRMVIQEAANSLGPQDKCTLTNMAALAKKFSELANYEQSLQVYQDILKELSKALDPSHNDLLLQTQISIAQILSTLGKHDEALLMYEGVLQKQLTTLGLSNLKTLFTKHSIAKILSIQGKYENALRHYQDIYDNLPPDHKNNYHDKLITTQNKAQQLAYMGQYAESLKLYKENEAKFSKSFGDSHAFTLITKLNIAQVLSNMADYNSALDYYDICINSKKKFDIGPNGGKFEETAKRQKEKAVCDQAQMPSVQTPDTVDTSQI